MPLSLYNLFKYKISKIALILIILFSLNLTLPLLVISKSIKVIENETNLPVKNATVKLFVINDEINLSKNPILRKTNENGDFEIEKKYEKYPIHCTVSCVGFYRTNDTITATTKTIKLIKKIIYSEEVVTTGQFIPTTAQESPFSVKVITQERIEAQGAVNLRDIMTNELNVRIGQDNVLGSSMSIRGVSGQNVKILIDGVPVIGRVGGNIDISQMNMNNVEKIEIIEGPLSTVYGTDALGGVINIITKNNLNQKTNFNFNSFIESSGNYNFDGNYSSKIDETLNLSGNFGRNFFDGFDPIDENRRNLLWKPKEQYFGDLNLGYNLKNWDFKYALRGFQEIIQNKGAPRQPYFETAFDDYYTTYRTTNSLYIKGKVYNEKYLDMIFSFNTFERLKNTFSKDLITLSENESTIPGDNDTTFIGAFMARGTFSSDKSLKENIENNTISYQLGYDLNYEYVSGERILNPDGSSELTNLGDYAGFFSIQYNLTKDILIQPSIRYTYNTNYDAPIVPSLNFKANIDENLVFRANYAKGFRAPSLKELYLFFVDVNHNIKGNANLIAETSDTYGANLEYSLTTDNAIVKFEPKVFYNDIQNQISLAFIDNTLYSYVNIGEFKSQGGEFSVHCITEDVTSKVGMSYIGRQNMINDTIQSPDMLYSTEIQANVMYDIKDLGMKLSGFYKYTGKLPSLQLSADNTLQRFEISGFHTLDITLSKMFLDDVLNFTIGAKNLLDVTNLTSNVVSTGGIHSVGGNQFPSAVGRTIFTSIRVNLN